MQQVKNIQKFIVLAFFSFIQFNTLYINVAYAAETEQAITVAFSPDGDAENMVLDCINSAQSSIRLAGYSFTSEKLTNALIRAKNRGVDVAVIVDYKNNVNQEHSKKVLSKLSNAGVPVRLISAYAIHHDKYIVVDRLHVQTGSFNYTKSAAVRNSENVMVIWNNSQLAKKYLDHWLSRWNSGTPLQ